MSLIKAIKAQLGLSGTATQNFTLTAEAADGTMKLARGNAGATTQDILTVDASGLVSFPQGIGTGSSLTTKLVTDSTDIVLNDIASSYSTVGSSFSVNIPTSGIIRFSFNGRIRADATTGCNVYQGLRIGTTNYWAGEYVSVNAGAAAVTLRYQSISAGGGSINDYTEFKGAGGSPVSGGVAVSLGIQAMAIPTGTQTVQLIAARSSASGACSIRGTTTPTRVVLEFVSAS